MNDAIVNLITTHPKTAVIASFTVGIALVPLLKAIGWFF